MDKYKNNKNHGAQHKMEAIKVLRKLKKLWCGIVKVFAGAGYRGKLVLGVKEMLGYDRQIVKQKYFPLAF